MEGQYLLIWPTADIVCLYFSRCVSNQRPLLDSGTMGTKGHTEIIVPNLTESYNSHVSMCEGLLLICCSGGFQFLPERHSPFPHFSEGPPRGGDPILHSQVFPLCHRAHHPVGQRQGEYSGNPTGECFYALAGELSNPQTLSLALSSSRTRLSTSPPCLTHSGRPTPHLK